MLSIEAIVGHTVMPEMLLTLLTLFAVLLLAGIVFVTSIFLR